jgi:hypothetical protein
MLSYGDAYTSDFVVDARALCPRERRAEARRQAGRPGPQSRVVTESAAGHGGEGLKSVASRGELGFDPTVDASVEDVEREGAAGEDLIMEGLEVEPGAELLPCALTQLANL